MCVSKCLCEFTFLEKRKQLIVVRNRAWKTPCGTCNSFGWEKWTCFPFQNLTYTVLYVISPFWKWIIYTHHGSLRTLFIQDTHYSVYCSMPLLSQRFLLSLSEKPTRYVSLLFQGCSYYPTSELLMNLIWDFLHSCLTFIGWTKFIYWIILARCKIMLHQWY